MEYLGERIYLLVQEGDIVACALDEESLEGLAYNINNANIEDCIEDCGRDVDDLTDEEYGEIAILSGFENGYAYVASIVLPEEEPDDDIDFELDNGDTFSYYTIVSALHDAENEFDDDFEEDDDYE